MIELMFKVKNWVWDWHELVQRKVHSIHRMKSENINTLGNVQTHIPAETEHMKRTHNYLTCLTKLRSFTRLEQKNVLILYNKCFTKLSVCYDKRVLVPLRRIMSEILTSKFVNLKWYAEVREHKIQRKSKIYSYHIHSIFIQ
jgi:hypothetical protein